MILKSNGIRKKHLFFVVPPHADTYRMPDNLLKYSMDLESLISGLSALDRRICADRDRRDHYDHAQRNSDHLLICLGQSWTKGNGLADPHNELFGAQIGKNLGCDWLNIGGDGLSGSWALTNFEFLVQPLNESAYNSGTIIMTFTEIGRDIADYSGRRFDYISAYSDHGNLHTLYDKVLDDIEYEWANRLEKIRYNLDNRFRIVVGCDMIWHERLKQGCDKIDDIIWCGPRWIDILADSIDKTRSSICRITAVDSLDIINNLLKIKDRTIYKSWFAKQSELALETIDWMANTPEYFTSHDLGHPNALGHKLWADHITELLLTLGPGVANPRARPAAGHAP